ncbi:MAG TPA: isopentenyl-diphosphate Delta-isomerase [Gemmatimonadales bacterium]|nr:isopentenyl-diphosphate Delta-isomerase [Gemmatimonadales bacterium]
MTEERVILVSSSDQPVGTAEKMAAHRDGLLHRAFSVFLEDRAGRLLLQRRARHKYHSGGLWSNACCGHPRPGEGTQEAATRRVREELGVEVVLSPAGVFTYRAEFANGLVEHEVDHVWVGLLHQDPQPDPQEVDEWRWVAPAAVESDLTANPQAYSAWLGPALNVLGQWRRRNPRGRHP